MWVECEMRNGHPWSAGGVFLEGPCGEDKRLLSDADPEEQKIIMKWISENLIKRKTPNMFYSSYNYKHMLENETGIHITNNQMKDAMLLAGYEPVVINELNWCFCISMKSPAIRRRRMVRNQYAFWR